MISFLAIAGAWDSHHDLFRYSKSFDSRLRTLNTVWLLMIILTPFAAKMLTTSGHQTLNAQALRFGFYALLQVVESAAMLGMVRRMVARGDMADAPRTVTDALAWQCYVLMIGFGVSIPRPVRRLLCSGRPGREGRAGRARRARTARLRRDG
jgi:uncharacterized membrane protein